MARPCEPKRGSILAAHTACRETSGLCRRGKCRAKCTRFPPIFCARNDTRSHAYRVQARKSERERRLCSRSWHQCSRRPSALRWSVPIDPVGSSQGVCGEQAGTMSAAAGAGSATTDTPPSDHERDADGAVSSVNDTNTPTRCVWRRCLARARIPLTVGSVPCAAMRHLELWQFSGRSHLRTKMRWKVTWCVWCVILSLRPTPCLHAQHGICSGRLV